MKMKKFVVLFLIMFCCLLIFGSTIFTEMALFGGSSSQALAQNMVATQTKTLTLSTDKTYQLAVYAKQFLLNPSVTVHVTYDPLALEVVDLCAYTPQQETASTVLEAYNLSVVPSGNEITITRTGGVPGYYWTGVLTVLKFRSLKDSGTTELTYRY